MINKLYLTPWKCLSIQRLAYDLDLFIVYVDSLWLIMLVVYVLDQRQTCQIQHIIQYFHYFYFQFCFGCCIIISSVTNSILLNLAIQYLIDFKMNSNQSPLALNESIVGSVTKQPATTTKNKYQIQNFFNSQSSDGKSEYKNRIRRLTIAQVCSGICLIIALFIAFAIPPIIEHSIVENSKEEMIMTSKNQNRWAHFPGQSKTNMLKKLTFFRFDNPDQFLFHNQKPIFRQISGFTIEELEDYFDIEYLQDGNKIRAKDWVRFGEWHESRKLDEKIRFLNMGSLAYWARLKHARPTQILQQGLAQLFTSLEVTLIPSLIGSGIRQQYLHNSSSVFATLLSPAGIQKNNSEFIWSDRLFGLSEKKNVGFWAQAAVNCFNNSQHNFVLSNEANTIKNYFVLTDGQTKFLMQKFYNYTLGASNLLLYNHYCAEVSIEECTGRYLAVAQLAEGWVTSHTPPVSTLAPSDTICADNTTCKGKFPQLYAFAKNVFHIDRNLAKTLKFNYSMSAGFSRETVLGWFNYNHSIEQGINYNTAENCLLHIGNLDALWEMGMKFEKSLNPELLEPIRIRFKLETVSHALVFWRWLLYFTNDFVLQNGNNINTGIATLFTSGLYRQFAFLRDNLQRFLLAKMLRKSIAPLYCQYFFQNSLDQTDNPHLISRLCQQYDTQTEQFSLKMVDVCQRKFGAEWEELNKMGVGLLGMENFCDRQGKGVGNYLHQHKIELDKLYNCSATPNSYCSDFELALLQWHNSTVTLNPPNDLSLPAATSFSKWCKGAQAIEYQHFAQTYFPTEAGKFPRYTLEELYGYLTFEEWFNANSFSKLLIMGSLHPYFLKYVRYVCIQISLNGFTTILSVRDFLFGYEDNLIKSVRTKYPPFGGDPSTPPMIAFNDLNRTKEQTTQTLLIKTGKDDYRNAYHVQEINGFRYFVNNYSSFNGNRTFHEWKSPWAEDVYFYGTLGRMFGPNQFQTDNLSTIITQVQRFNTKFFHNQTEKVQLYGLDVYKTRLASGLGEVNPSTAKYYQTIYNVFNASTIYNSPLYITKSHFMNCSEWLEKVQIYNENKTIHYQQPTKQDDSFTIIEAYTGACLQNHVYLQTNYYHQKDLLFDYPIDTMLPLFSASRGGTITEEKFNEFYGSLITALTIKNNVVYAGITLGMISLVIMAISYLKKRKLAVDKNIKSQMEASMEGEQNINESLIN